MHEQFWIITIALLSNVMMVLVFARLAIVFDKWWIALFALCLVKDVKFRNAEKNQEEDSDGE